MRRVSSASVTAFGLVLALGAGCSSGEDTGASAPVPDTASAEAGLADALPDQLRPFQGMMTYFADAPRFTDCASGASFVLAQEADYVAAERAYLDAQAQGEPLRVAFDGRLTRRPGMEGGEVDAVVVVAFHGAFPGQGCGAEPVAGLLEGTPWRLVALPGAVAVPSDVEATLLLDPDTRRAMGSTGCNRYAAGYALEGGRLTVSVTDVTRLACPPSAAAVETDFLEALRMAGGYRFVGAFLELVGEAGAVARFAVPD